MNASNTKIRPFRLWWQRHTRRMRSARRWTRFSLLRSDGECGSVLPLLVVVVLVAGTSAVGLARLASAAVNRSRAQQAADAAALAGARFDRAEAERLASLNGATVGAFVEQFEGRSRVVSVQVVLDDVAASATARWDPPPPPPPPPPSMPSTTTTISDPADPSKPNDSIPVEPFAGRFP